MCYSASGLPAKAAIRSACKRDHGKRKQGWNRPHKVTYTLLGRFRFAFVSNGKQWRDLGLDCSLASMGAEAGFRHSGQPIMDHGTCWTTQEVSVPGNLSAGICSRTGHLLRGCSHSSTGHRRPPGQHATPTPLLHCACKHLLAAQPQSSQAAVSPSHTKQEGSPKTPAAAAARAMSGGAPAR